MKKLSLIKSKKYVIYAKKDLVLMIIIKSIIKLEIIVTTEENVEELLIVFVISEIKHQKRCLQYFIMALHMIIFL